MRAPGRMAVVAKEAPLESSRPNGRVGSAHAFCMKSAAEAIAALGRGASGGHKATFICGIEPTCPCRLDSKLPAVRAAMMHRTQ